MVPVRAPALSRLRANPLVNTPSDGAVSRGTQGNPSGGVPGSVFGWVRSGLYPNTPMPS
jgi:hypothetical protein